MEQCGKDAILASGGYSCLESFMLPYRTNRISSPKGNRTGLCSKWVSKFSFFVFLLSVFIVIQVHSFLKPIVVQAQPSQIYNHEFGVPAVVGNRSTRLMFIYLESKTIRGVFLSCFYPTHDMLSVFSISVSM